jgi:hypothetical protein
MCAPADNFADKYIKHEYIFSQNHRIPISTLTSIRTYHKRCSLYFSGWSITISGPRHYSLSYSSYSTCTFGTAGGGHERLTWWLGHLPSSPKSNPTPYTMLRSHTNNRRNPRRCTYLQLPCRRRCQQDISMLITQQRWMNEGHRTPKWQHLVSGKPTTKADLLEKELL